MKNGRLRERDGYTYGIIKDVFAYYSGQTRRFDVDVYSVHLDIMSLLWIHGRISDGEYKIYKKHLYRASQACTERYYATL